MNELAFQTLTKPRPVKQTASFVSTQTRGVLTQISSSTPTVLGIWQTLATGTVTPKTTTRLVAGTRVTAVSVLVFLLITNALRTASLAWTQTLAVSIQDSSTSSIATGICRRSAMAYVCHPDNNNEACGWDGGDCCKCTCDGSECLSLDGTECMDPEAASEKNGCHENHPVSLPCLPEQRKWKVENSSQARALAEALNCSGGSFEVE